MLDKKLQVGMSLHITGFLYMYLVLFALLANFAALKTVVFGGSEEAYLEAVTRLDIFVEVFVFPLVATFVCMCLHGFLFTHRIAGPVYRIKEMLKRVQGGDLATDVKLRKNDYFQDLCEDLNGMIDQLRGDLVHFRQASQKLADEGEALAASGDLPPESQAKLLGITNASTRLRQLVDGYRLQPDEATDEPEFAEPRERVPEPV
jgi:methyl-accepting chemotaxis protein